VDHDAALIGGGLRRAGVRRGHVVSWQLPNSPDVASLYRACWHIGAVAAPVHHAFAATDTEMALKTVDPELVVDLSDLARWRAEADPAAPADDATPDDLAVILFTSGSSGAPKAVQHTRGALDYKARTMVSVHGLTSDDVVLMPAPCAHVSGLLNGVLVPHVAGMGVVFMAKWDPDRALDLIDRHRVSYMVGPPTFFVGLMQASTFTRERAASMRLVSSGGAGVTPAFVDEASERLGCVVKRTYGSTEVPSVTTSYAGDPPERARTTDGRVVGDAQIRLSPASGELEVRGPEMFVGYVDAQQTRDAMTDDGWFRTGDLAAIDDGWLTITGRLKDVVIRGGENIGTGEVEAVLEAHPAVRHAVVVGEPDDRLGERVAAFVVGALDLDECRRWFAERGVAKFKWPERVVAVDALPVLASGKPDRTALRARLAACGS
jgi:acyl-CoA synthetase (AMP-forming)/AMP-acid ligase II